MDLLPEHCQRLNTAGRHAWKPWILTRLRQALHIRTHFRRRFGRTTSGPASRFREGDWVRVLERADLENTLDEGAKTRGLRFLPYQYAYCGGIYRVQKVMRQMVDDEGVFRPVSRTVLLEGIYCPDPPGEGCGRRCPLMFRDEWLLAATPPADYPKVSNVGRYVRIKRPEEIRSTLNRRGRKDGIQFMPEMYRYAGQRFKIAREVNRVFEDGLYTDARAPFCILEGLSCSGAVVANRGGCDRSCALLWHKDWLEDV